MAQIISFTAAKQRRQIQALEAIRHQQREEAQTRTAIELVEAYADGDLLTAAVKATQLKKISTPESRPMPAYCNPSNETKGSKYEANAGKSLPALAKMMREDIKAAKKRGQLPKALKVSVRSEYFSGGGAIRMAITGLPDGQRLYTSEYAKLTNNFTQSPPWEWRGTRYTAAIRGWLELLEEIHSAYNRDNSDSMTDYFDVNFYGSVDVGWELDSACRKAEQYTPQPIYTNSYSCELCGCAWSSECNDREEVERCGCGAELEPISSEEAIETEH